MALAIFSPPFPQAFWVLVKVSSEYSSKGSPFHRFADINSASYAIFEIAVRGACHRDKSSRSNHCTFYIDNKPTLPKLYLTVLGSDNREIRQ